MIKILIGGSPCTFWSIAQKNGRDTEAEGMGWELFKNQLIAKEKFQPDLFLYENNKSAAQPIKDQIAEELNVNLMYINSALVSAQNRQRFYAFNWEVEQPEDRGIILRDILETGNPYGETNDKSYALTATYYKGQPIEKVLTKSQRTMVANPVGVGYRNRREEDGQLYRRFETHNEEKSNAITTVQTDSMVAEPLNVTSDGKSQTLKAQYHKNNASNFCCYTSTFGATGVAEPVRIGDIGSTAQAHRVYSCDGKSVTINAGGGGQGGKTGLYATPVENVGDCQTIEKAIPKLVEKFGYVPEKFNAYNVAEINDKSPTLSTGSMVTSSCATTIFEKSNKPIYEVKDGLITIKDRQYPIKLQDGFYIIRKLTPIECERLQTLPDGYTEGVSNTQRYKGLGNGWTAEVIIHILNGALKDVPKDEEIVVLSMYDGIGTGRYCLDKMGFTNVKYYAYEIDKQAIKIAMKNYPDIIQCGDAFAIREEGWCADGVPVLS